MKRIITLSAMMLLFFGSMFAQKLSYQAVVRNSQTNELMVSATMNVTVNILNANDEVQYTETHTGVQSNMNGLITLTIGEGTNATTSLNNVDWNGASIRSTITIQGIDPITITTPVNAVPYALQAANASGSFDQVQADWNETDENAKSFIKHKPTIPEAPDLSNYVTENKLNDTLNSYVKQEVDPTVPGWAKEDNKPVYNYNEIQNTPVIPTVNDVTINFTQGNEALGSFTTNAAQGNTIDIPAPDLSNYVTENKLNDTLNSYLKQEVDPTVPGWAKEANKPVYYYNEIQNTPEIPTVNDVTINFTQGNEALGSFTTNAAQGNTIDIPAPDLSNYVTENKLNDTLNSYLKQEVDPTVKNSTITIQKNGEPVGSFTLNQGNDQIINIAVPTSGGGQAVPQTISISGNTITLSDGGGTVTLPAETDPTIYDWARAENKPVYNYNEIQNTPEIPTVNNDTLFINYGNTPKGYFTANANTNTTITIPATDLTGYVQEDVMKQAISDSLALFKAQLMAEVTTMLPTYMAGYMADYMAQNLPTLMQPYMEALNIHTASELTVITPNNIQQLTLANTPKEDTEVLMYINGVMVGSTASGVISVNNNKTVTYNPNANYGYNLQDGDKVTFVYVY